MGNKLNKVTTAGLLVALGIIYGDIGTSPLYVLNAITSGKTITEELAIESVTADIGRLWAAGGCSVAHPGHSRSSAEPVCWL